MPIRQIDILPSMEGPMKVGDEAEIDHIVNGRLRALLAAPDLRAELMPPGRRNWFEAFIKRSIESALLLNDRTQLNYAWECFEGALVGRGVLQVVLATIEDANDSDVKDVWRGWHRPEQLKEKYFLSDKRDVREILKSAIETPDFAVWQRYPGWFGSVAYGTGTAPAEDVAFWRRRAARFLPCFSPDDPLLRGVLDEDVSEVRHVAAVHLAKLDPAALDDQLLTCLLAAAADQDWVWSWRHSSFRGCDEAMSLLERFGGRARAAAPLLEAQIAEIEAYSDGSFNADLRNRRLAEARRQIGVFKSDA